MHDTAQFGAQLPLSGSALCDAIVTLRNLDRTGAMGKQEVASEIEKIIIAWERS